MITTRPPGGICLGLYGVAVRYRRRWALHPTTLELRAGRVLGIVGPNGAGKTTLLSAALGVSVPSAGTVVLADHIGRRRGAGVGAVLERDGLLPGLSAEQTLRMWAPLVGVADRERVHEVLAEVGLDGVGAQRVATFSLGMRRRLALARVLLSAPDLLVLDEPGNGLDPRGVLALRGLVRRRAADGAAVVLSSHSLTDVDDLCDDIAYLDRGEITVRWGPDEPRWWRCGVEDSDVVRALALLSAAGVHAEPEAPASLLVRQDGVLHDVLACLRAGGVDVTGVTDLGRDLQRPFRGSGGWGR